MNNKNINTILYIVVFIFVFIMFGVTAYSYYVKTNKNENIKKEEKHFNMMVSFDNTNEIEAHNLRNGYEIVKEFNVKNYSKDTIGTYKLQFEVITPLSNMVDEDFVYTVEGVSESKDSSNKVINILETPVPVLTKTLGTANITPNNTHTYKLTIKLNNNKYYSDSLFSVKINVIND